MAHHANVEPIMTKFKVLSASSALALALVLASPTAGFAQHRGPGGGGGNMGGAHMGGGMGGGSHMGGTVGMGGGAPAGPRTGGGGNFAATAPGARTGGTFTGPRTATGPNFAAGTSTGQTFTGGRTAWNGGWRGDRFHHRGFWPGFAAGAALGSYAYYGGGPYYDDYYYGDYGPDYYESDVAVPVAPVGGDAVAYCESRFRSYDPASGTYLGYDGMRHPCP
jgi:hypothetical protein